MKIIKNFILVLLLISNYSCYKEIDDHFDIEKGTFIDERDNTEYPWIKIENQIWMAKNLAYLPSISDVRIGDYDKPHYYVYGCYNTRQYTWTVEKAKNTINYMNYGVLYNWEAAIKSCPSGWHLPSDDEWNELQISLGMDPNKYDNVDWIMSGQIGKKLKSVDWNGNNISEFNALPGGYRSNSGEYVGLERLSRFQASTEGSVGGGWNWNRFLNTINSGINRSYDYKTNSFSVRCIKD
jgi:uncharacterized protein (TIGR02145 family)